MENRVKVYVRSEKVAIGVTEIREPDTVTFGNASMSEKVRQVVQYDYLIPDDQKLKLEFVRNICEERGYQVEVTDVTKESILKKIGGSETGGADQFPIVITPFGKKVYGDNLNHAVLQELLPADLNGKEVRGFVYLKIKKGNEQKLLEKLVQIPEVREVHLIPGEWDAFCVVGLPPVNGSSERKILDFVISTIRSIEWVESTSTLVPVYSYSKFTVLTEARKKLFSTIENV
jgi:DNA-binding Lrp family transcriptional regulator